MHIAKALVIIKSVYRYGLPVESSSSEHRGNFDPAFIQVISPLLG